MCTFLFETQMFLFLEQDVKYYDNSNGYIHKVISVSGKVEAIFILLISKGIFGLELYKKT